MVTFAQKEVLCTLQNRTMDLVGSKSPSRGVGELVWFQPPTLNCSKETPHPLHQLQEEELLKVHPVHVGWRFKLSPAFFSPSYLCIPDHRR